MLLFFHILFECCFHYLSSLMTLRFPYFKSKSLILNKDAIANRLIKEIQD